MFLFLLHYLLFISHRRLSLISSLGPFPALPSFTPASLLSHLTSIPHFPPSAPSLLWRKLLFYLNWSQFLIFLPRLHPLLPSFPPSMPTPALSLLASISHFPPLAPSPPFLLSRLLLFYLISLQSFISLPWLLPLLSRLLLFYLIWLQSFISLPWLLPLLSSFLHHST